MRCIVKPAAQCAADDSPLDMRREPGTAAALLAGGRPWREHSVMLHQPGQWPAGAIAPAYALPLPAGRAPAAAAASGAAASSGVAASSGATSTSPAHLWLWLHPAAYEEVLQALRVEAESRAAASSSDGSVRVLPLGAHLRRLELRGPQSAAAIAVLLPQLAGAAMRPAADGTVHACLLQVTVSSVLQPRASGKPVDEPHHWQLLRDLEQAQRSRCLVQDPRLRGEEHKDAGGAPARTDGAATASSQNCKAHSAQPMPQRAAVDASGNTALARLWEQPAAFAPPYSQHQVGVPENSKHVLVRSTCPGRHAAGW